MKLKKVIAVIVVLAVTVGAVTLIQYDTSEAEIDIQRKNLEISTTENSLAKAQHSLESLKNTKPVDKTRPSTASTASSYIN